VLVSLIGTHRILLKDPTVHKIDGPVDPICYLYYPPINDSSWMKKCGTDYLYNLLNRQLSQATPTI
jgi:hypothetical protein